MAGDENEDGIELENMIESDHIEASHYVQHFSGQDLAARSHRSSIMSSLKAKIGIFSLLLVLMIGMTVFGIVYFENHVKSSEGNIQHETEHGYEVDDRENIPAVEASMRFGFVTLYIWDDVDRNEQDPARQVQLPVVRLNRHEYVPDDSLVFFKKNASIAEKQSTKETVIYSEKHVFIFPSISTGLNGVLSVAELVQSQNMSFTRVREFPSIEFGIESLFTTKSLVKTEIPLFNTITYSFEESFIIQMTPGIRLKSSDSYSKKDRYASDEYAYRRRRPPKKEPEHRFKEPDAQTLRNSLLTKCSETERNTNDLVNRIMKNVGKQSTQQMNASFNITNRPQTIGSVKNQYIVVFSPGTGITNGLASMQRTLVDGQNNEETPVKIIKEIKTSIIPTFVVESKLNSSADVRQAMNALQAFPVKMVKRPVVNLKNMEVPDTRNLLNGSLIPHSWTGVKNVHDKFKNFGAGVKVAVIDSGIYYDHPALGGCFGEGCKVAGGYDFVGDLYGIGNNLPEPDPDPMDNCPSGSHGTHVAGIIAADARSVTGALYKPFAPFTGVAPDVSLHIYRVFGCYGGTTTGIIIQAMLQALADGVDIINLSLGGPSAYEDPAIAFFIEMIASLGVYITVSAGNDGESGIFTTSDPALELGAISVGSVDNIFTPSLFNIIAPDQTSIPYGPGTAFGGWTSVVQSRIVVNDPKRGVSDGCNGTLVSVRGCVVVFGFTTQDSCGSNQRCNLAAAAGATGCILYNVGSIFGGDTIPSGSISLADGLKILKIYAENPNAIYTFTNDKNVQSITTGKTMSSFSAYGLTGDLDLYPTISAPGGYIYSTISRETALSQNLQTAYAVYSGTSMAAPYMAGVLALFLASIGNPPRETVNGTSTDGVCRPFVSEVIKLFQSNAQIIRNYNSTLYSSVAWQGAGLVDAYRSITAPVMFSDSQIALRDSIRRKDSYTVKLINFSNKTVIYELSAKGAALLTGLSKTDDQLLLSPVNSADFANVHIYPRVVDIKPGQSREITLTFEDPSDIDESLLPIYSGFICAKNRATGQISYLSYAGMAGNYQEAQILVRSSPTGFVTGVLNAQQNYIAEDGISFLSASDTIFVRFVLAWPTRAVWVEVVSANGIGLPGWYQSLGIVSDFQYMYYYEDLPRNVGTTLAQSYFPSFDIAWNGAVVGYVVTLDSYAFYQLPQGLYRIKISALKHFGNIEDPRSIELYHSPLFYLANN